MPLCPLAHCCAVSPQAVPPHTQGGEVVVQVLAELPGEGWTTSCPLPHSCGHTSWDTLR